MGYDNDLAYIHDSGFSGFALGAAPGLIACLRRNGIRGGLVVDLGCGSGRWARALNDAGYDCLGVDQSPAFVRMARQVAPQSKFVCSSLADFEIPPCAAVTAIGEVLNYTFDRRGGRLLSLFRRIHRALQPGGLFAFDAAGPSRAPDQPRRVWTEGEGWAVLVETSGNPRTLTRKIVCFRRVGKRYRRSEETHVIRLYDPDEVLRALETAGFETEAVDAYGRFRLYPGINGFIARKMSS